MAPTQMRHADDRGRWRQRYFFAAFVFAFVTCYSAQVAHFYKHDDGARQCDRCQVEPHVVAEPMALQYAPAAQPLPRRYSRLSSRPGRFLPDPRGIWARGRAPPAVFS